MPAAAKTYGQVVRKDGVWGIRAVPHVTVILKRLFIRADQSTPGVLIFRDTPEVARDLEWFLQRWPLKGDPGTLAYLAQRAAEHRATEEAVFTLLNGYRRPDNWREPVRAPRGYQLVAADLVHTTGRALLGDDVGLGKAQPLDSSVLTPAGFKRMGDIKIGDLVIAGDGTAVRITGVYPQGERDCYRVSFGDGSFAECSEDHLWTVRYYRSGRSKVTGQLLPKPVAIMTVRQLLERGLLTAGGHRQGKWHVPMITAPDLECGAARPLHPYVLGALLGDGGLTGSSVMLTTADDELAATVQAHVPPGVVVKRREKSSYGYALVDTGRQRDMRPCLFCGNDRRGRGARGLCGRCYQSTPKAELPPLRDQPRQAILEPLKDLGLWGHLGLDKFIPEQYKLAPVVDRLALLQGLMDTDGYAMPLSGGSASAFFSSSSVRLAKDVRWLAESLGGTGRLGDKYADGRLRYTVTVKLPQPYNPFRLSRKARIWGNGHAKLKPTRPIVAIEKTGRKPMQCIAIDHPSRLYVTDRFAVTHNTFSALLVLRNPAALPALIVAPAHLCSQWLGELEISLPWLRGHITAKRDPYDLAARCGGQQPDVVITSYPKFPYWADYLAGNVATVIYDEIHELRRGTEAAKGRAAIHVSAKAAFRVGASATPVHNYGGEIWEIIQPLDPDALGSRDEFAREWCGSNRGLAQHAVVKDPAALGEYLRGTGLMLRRTRQELHMELPETLQIEQPVDTDHDAIDQVAADLVQQARILLGEVDATGEDKWHAASEVDWRLRRATGLAKAPYVAAFARLLLESEDRLVMFGWHRDVYDIWLSQLADFNPLLYTGSETPAQKARNAAAFMNGESRVLIMSLKSGAGLDGLQKCCSLCVFGELDWSPEQHLQCVGRLARDGQTSPVVAYFMTSDDGTDPHMAEVLGLKRAQSVPIRDPQAELFEALTPATDRARTLAADVLRRIGTRKGHRS